MTRLLLVEDDHFDQILFTKRLSMVRPDWIIEHAGDLIEAAQRLEHATYDVVVTDLMLPGAAGEEVLRGLVGAGATRIIVLTGLQDVDVSAWPSVVAHIEKADFDPEGFAAAINAIG